MFARTLNELRVKLAITIPSDSLLLIKEGRHMSEEEQRRLHLADKKHVRIFNEDQRISRRGKPSSHYQNLENPCFAMAFVFSRTKAGDRYYLPGASLRGVLRQAAERAIAERRPDLIVDPFAASGRHAGSDRAILAERERAEIEDVETVADRPDSVRIYRETRPIERCFGHTLLRGRWSIEDAWPEENRTPGVTIRDGVGIDRTTGAARDQIKFDFEALTSGTFTTTLTLVNYELWQLGLLAHALAALDGGDVRLGYGTRRGLGRVRWIVRELAFRWYPERPETKTANKQAVELVIPTLSALAGEASLMGDYGWHDAGLNVTLPLRYESRFPAGNWVLQPSSSSAKDGWNVTPWPQLGRLLSKGLAYESWTTPSVPKEEL